MNKLYIKTIALIISCCFSLFTKAQIVYTDIADTTLWRSGDQAGALAYIIDINNDATDDYNLGVRASVIIPTGCTINPPTQTNLSAWAGTMPGFSNNTGDINGSVASVNYGTLIDDVSFTWNFTQQDYLTQLEYTYPSCVWDSTLTGNWINGTNYIPVRFRLGAQSHYGWIRVRLESGRDSSGTGYIEMEIFDYAYNSSPNQPIIAGDNGMTGIEHADWDKVKVFPNPASEKIEFKFTDAVPLEIKVFNSSGLLISNQESSDRSYTIHLDNYAAGLYYYFISTENKTVQKGKFIVQ